MATVKVLLREEKVNAKGLAPIYLRIIKDRKTKFVALGVYIKPIDWNPITGKVKKSHPNSGRMNSFLAQKEAEAEGIALEMQTKSKSVSTHKIKENILGKSSPEFFVYAEKYLSSLKAGGKIGTYKRAKTVITKLKEFTKGKHLFFDDFTVSFLKEYEDHLLINLRNKTNTVHANLKLIRTILNNATSEDLIQSESNPFNRYKLRTEATERAYLTEMELKAIEDLALPEKSMINHHRNIYVFAAYAGGMRVSDILKLKWSNFDGEKINIQIHKTKTQLSIKLPDAALQILNLYRGSSMNTTDSYIFPLLKIHPNEKDPLKIHNAISSATAYTNKDLKKLSELAGINKHLSFHTSRHTWATRALRKGMRMEYVSKIMGHAAIKETQIYARIINAELDNAMEIFN